jgi:tRNA(fMet)-specific endonuclease VapC
VRYLLDSNVVIRLLNSDQRITRRIHRHERSDFGLPVIVMHELYFGAFKSRRVSQNISFLESLDFEILDFQAQDAIKAGEIRAALAAKGTPIGPFDLLIAGQAVARDLTLITNNLREFNRVDQLRVEDWQAA